MSVPHGCMQSPPGACREPVVRLHLSTVCRVLCVTSPGPQHISWFLPCFSEVGPMETTPSPGCVVGSIPSLGFLQVQQPRALSRDSAQCGHWVSPPEDSADSS